MVILFCFIFYCYFMQILMKNYGKHKMWMILNAAATVMRMQTAPVVWCTETTSAHALRDIMGRAM